MAGFQQSTVVYLFFGLSATRRPAILGWLVTSTGEGQFEFRQSYTHGDGKQGQTNLSYFAFDVDLGAVMSTAALPSLQDLYRRNAEGTQALFSTQPRDVMVEEESRYEQYMIHCSD